jgi:hypothetical protein
MIRARTFDRFPKDSALSFRFELFWLASPLLADFVAKVENRTTPKILRKLIFRPL